MQLVMSGFVLAKLTNALPLISEILLITEILRFLSIRRTSIAHLISNFCVNALHIALEFSALVVYEEFMVVIRSVNYSVVHFSSSVDQ